VLVLVLRCGVRGVCRHEPQSLPMSRPSSGAMHPPVGVLHPALGGTSQALACCSRGRGFVGAGGIGGCPAGRPVTLLVHCPGGHVSGWTAPLEGTHGGCIPAEFPQGHRRQSMAKPIRRSADSSQRNRSQHGPWRWTAKQWYREPAAIWLSATIWLSADQRLSAAIRLSVADRSRRLTGTPGRWIIRTS